MKTATTLLLTLQFLLPAIASAQDEQPPETDPPATIVQEFPLDDYNGSWVLNARLSDNPAALMGSTGNSGRPGGAGGRRSGGMGGGRGGGMGGVMGGGMGGGMGGRSATGDGNDAGRRFGREGQDTGTDPFARQRLRMQKEYSRLEIYLEFPELNLTDGLDIMQLYSLDGRETNVWTPQGEMTARSELKEGKLQVALEGRDPDQARTRTFSLTQDARQLILDEERLLPGREEPVTIRRVYDRTLGTADD